MSDFMNEHNANYILDLLTKINTLETQLQELKSIGTVKIGWRAFREGVKIPEKKTEGAFALDVCAWIENNGSVEVLPGEMKPILTGLNVFLPETHGIKIESRSGLSYNYEVSILGGVIDSDFSGIGEAFEIKILFKNNSKTKTLIINNGDRIAQFVVHVSPKVETFTFDELPEDFVHGKRIGGFGTTGIQ